MSDFLNDGSSRAPRLARFLNLGSLAQLPDWVDAPHGDEREVFAALKELGYEGVQGGDPRTARDCGLLPAGGGSVRAADQAADFGRRLADAGVICATIHLGTGIESEDEAARLVETVLQAQADAGVPIYVETHRATLTQDMWRTVTLIERFPELRINADYSHWYTGLEMPYGDWDAKLAFSAPVFERVRFFHGRVGNPSNMQVDCGDGSEDGRPWLSHFKELWTRSMRALVDEGAPGDYLPFAPELLPAFYARSFPGPDGEPREECDRWQQAQLLNRIAEDCFAAVQKETVAGSQRP